MARVGPQRQRGKNDPSKPKILFILERIIQAIIPSNLNLRVYNFTIAGLLQQGTNALCRLSVYVKLQN
jgi:hypothetical protein